MKPKKVKCLKIILAICILLCIIIVESIGYLHDTDVSLEIKYKLSDLTDHQAVLVIASEADIEGYLPYYVIINKKGQYKIILEEEIEAEDDMKYRGLYPPKTFDLILQNKEIPYQEKRIWINPYFLQRAINIKEVEVYSSWMYCTMPSYKASSVIYGIDERKKVDLCTSSMTCDMDIPTYGYLFRKMREFENLAEEEIKERYQGSVTGN